MKTEPTEALRLIEYSWYALPNATAIDRKDCIKAVNIAFKEGQSNPKIKQLEWVEYENRLGRKSYFAKTPFTPFEVADAGGHYIMYSPGKRLRFASADDAKAAAQADFERRVRECLDYE
jgi:hypothetical protein